MLFQVFQSKVNNSHKRVSWLEWLQSLCFQNVYHSPYRLVSPALLQQHIETILSCEVQSGPVTLNSSMYSFVLWFLLESVLDKRHFVLCSNIWVSHCEIEDQKASIKGSFFFYKLHYPCFCSFSKQNSYRLQES